LLCANFRKSGDIIYIFLGIEGRQLSADMRQTFDNFDACRPHPAVKCGEQTSWSRSDYCNVIYLIRHIFPSNKCILPHFAKMTNRKGSMFLFSAPALGNDPGYMASSIVCHCFLWRQSIK